MKYIKIFIIAMITAMTLMACGAKESDAGENQQEEAAGYDSQEMLVRICKSQACKLGYQSGEILTMYASGQMSLEAASKLVKMNYEGIKYLHDLNIYTEDDSMYMNALYGNVMTAFDQLFEEGDGYLKNIDYISKCIDKLLAEE